MKKYTAFLLLLVFLVVHSLVYARELPEQTGIVTDPIGLFSKDEIALIEENFANQPYEVIVLTASGLEEEEGIQLANQAFDSWQLAKNQLMLVITIDPNTVHLVLDNIELKNKVSQSTARDAKGIIEQSFVPLAMDGRIAEGVIAVGELVNKIAVAIEQPSQPPAVTPSTPIPKTTPRPVIQVEQPLPINNERSTSTLYLIFGVIFLFIGGLIIANLFVKRGRIRNKHREALLSLKEAISQISSVMVSELLKELELGFMQGKTKQKLEELEHAVLQLYQQALGLQAHLSEQKITLFTSALTEQQINVQYKEVEAIKSKAMAYLAETKQLELTVLEVRRSVHLAKERANELVDQLERFAAETSYPLQILRNDLVLAQEALAVADHLDEFDVLEAGSEVQISHQRFDQFAATIEALKLQSKKFAEIPARVGEIEVQLRAIVGREQLLLIDADPFRLLEKAKSLLSKMGSLLQEGNSRELEAYLDEAEAHIRTAVDAVDQMLDHRDQSIHTIQEIESLLAELEHFEGQFAQEMNKLNDRYADRHIVEQQTRFSQIKVEQEQLEHLLAEIRADSDVRVQRYQHAFALSEEAKHILSQVKNIREQSISYYQTLESKLKKVKKELVNTSSSFYKAARLLEQLHIEHPLIKDASYIEEQLRPLEVLVDQPRYDLVLIEEKVSEITIIIVQFTHRVEQLIREKQEAERGLRELQELYTRGHSRYGHKISMSRYSGSYQQVYKQMEHLIALGLFAEAKKQLSEGQSILGQMEKEYKRVVAEERRRNSSHWGSGGGFGGGFGFGGGSGRSSGSSSWGSGSGRSSGSSGWGGGGGRSSGSSSWGSGSSGGGRSSGSSKW